MYKLETGSDDGCPSPLMRLCMKSKTDILPLSNRRERLKAKIRAKVRLRLQKELAKVILQMDSYIERLKIVQQELDSFNPRFHQLQTHTKAKWTNELQSIILV